MRHPVGIIISDRRMYRHRVKIIRRRHNELLGSLPVEFGSGVKVVTSGV